MSLFGALTSGVSGLTAQSSAMGAIADNITNVNTVGYKNVKVNFQTLVTKQTSVTFFSAGGVQSKPRQDTGVQGLLQASTSQTDISISGAGLFVVNEASKPTNSDQFLFTRAGSFFQDNEGFLRNTAGFYLQAWPVDAGGNVIPANTSLTVPNQNVISTDFLTTVNLNRIGGTATPTDKISIGANLPANDAVGATHKTDVQFFDTLGNANTVGFLYTRSIVDNAFDLTIEPPSGTSVLTIEDKTVPTPKVYDSIGQLEFNIKSATGDTTRRPANGATVIIDGLTYRFDNTGSPPADTATVKQVNVSSNTTVAQDVASLVAKVKASDSDFADYGDGPTVNNRISVSSASSTTILFHDDGTRATTIDPTGLLDTTGTAVTTQRSSFTVKKPALEYQDATQLLFSANPTGGTIVINGTTYTFDSSGAEASGDGDTTINASVNLATTLADLEDAIEANDANFATNGARVQTKANGFATPTTFTANTLVLSSLASGSYTVDASSMTGATVSEPDGTAFASSSSITVQTKFAINFDSKGLPSEFNISELEILGFASGAADMDDDPTKAKQITVDFGTVGEANGLTQFGAAFTPGFIQQNGSRFGNFAGVTIATDGVVTALFDNGETRPVFKIPVATFANVNGLDSRTGNAWNATEASGDPTLRVADNGPAGQVIQAALESSTSDIGEEFTKMIIVQRAFAAATRIISTSDQMLDELIRTIR